MMARFYFLVLIMISSVNYAAESQKQQKHHYKKSDDIAIQLLPYEDDPQNFLRFTSNRIDRNIRFSVKLNVKDIKLIDITDIFAEEERCDYRHSAKVSYSYFEPPINAREVIMTMSKPCIYKHNARLKLRIATDNNEFLYRVYTFPVHPLSNYY